MDLRRHRSEMRGSHGGLFGASNIVAVRRAPGLRRTPALMARLAVWKTGGYLLPLPTLRLRARLESGE